MKFSTIEDIVKEFEFIQKTKTADMLLLPKNEKVFKTMSFEELNEALKVHGLKCIIDSKNCCALTHDHLILKIDYVPKFRTFD